MSRLFVLAVILLAFAVSNAGELPALRGVRRILFLGDSITYSGEYVDQIDTYIHLNSPNRRIEIINLGLPSENLSGLTEPDHAGGAFPRPDLHDRLERALDKIKPDLVVACYGMNDGIYYPFSEDRFTAFKSGIGWLREEVLGAGAKLWLLTPSPFDPEPVRESLLPDGQAEYPSGHTFAGYDGVLARFSDWILSKQSEGWNVIDIHSPLNAYLAERRKTDPRFAFAGDGVHLNETGQRLIARAVLAAWGAPESSLPGLNPRPPGRENDPLFQIEDLIHQRQRILCDAWLTEVGHKRPGMAAGMPIREASQRAAELESRIRVIGKGLPIRFSGEVTDYHGYNRYDLKVDGLNAIVVAPTHLSSQFRNPWIWRAEFFDHRPELDLALLSRGFYLAFIDVGNTFGAPSAMAHWDVFYRLLTSRYGLSLKPTLEGLSRGGLYMYNWASRHPHCVSALYGDNPVCDFKSWPGGKGKGPGSPSDWSKLLADYGFKSEEEALAYRKNPIDNLEALAKAHVPIIHLAADADEVVPYPENTVILAERYRKLGGSIQVMVKHGFKHHPHGLDDPTPLVEFILAHAAK
ncbi:MAG TPA: SGNH/GDSL hydrolase family protein [Fimbriimonas sp.]|nr:SGNH/GDSL hydrolase family protein [Fimbriimonas sp.]